MAVGSIPVAAASVAESRRRRAITHTLRRGRHATARSSGVALGSDGAANRLSAAARRSFCGRRDRRRRHHRADRGAAARGRGPARRGPRDAQDCRRRDRPDHRAPDGNRRRPIRHDQRRLRHRRRHTRRRVEPRGHHVDRADDLRPLDLVRLRACAGLSLHRARGRGGDAARGSGSGLARGREGQVHARRAAAVPDARRPSRRASGPVSRA